MRNPRSWFSVHPFLDLVDAFAKITSFLGPLQIILAATLEEVEHHTPRHLASRLAELVVRARANQRPGSILARALPDILADLPRRLDAELDALFQVLAGGQGVPGLAKGRVRASAPRNTGPPGAGPGAPQVHSGGVALVWRVFHQRSACTVK